MNPDLMKMLLPMLLGGGGGIPGPGGMPPLQPGLPTLQGGAGLPGLPSPVPTGVPQGVPGPGTPSGMSALAPEGPAKPPVDPGPNTPTSVVGSPAPKASAPNPFMEGFGMPQGGMPGAPPGLPAGLPGMPSPGLPPGINLASLFGPGAGGLGL